MKYLKRLLVVMATFLSACSDNYSDYYDTSYIRPEIVIYAYGIGSTFLDARFLYGPNEERHKRFYLDEGDRLVAYAFDDERDFFEVVSPYDYAVFSIRQS